MEFGWLVNVEILINGTNTRVTHKYLSHVLRKPEMGGGGSLGRLARAPIGYNFNGFAPRPSTQNNAVSRREGTNGRANGDMPLVGEWLADWLTPPP